VPAVWNDPGIAWGSFALVAIRNTWDYHEQRDEFLAWVDRVARVSSIANAPNVLRWNTHKGYLRELAARGVAVVPTAWCAQGERADLDAILDARGTAGGFDWSVAVVKPAISAGARDTMRVTRENRAPARELLTKIVARCDAMIQPYLPSVEGHGERSLLFAGESFSHSVRKHALLARGAVGLEAQGDAVPSVQASAAEIAFAERVLAAAKAVTGATFAYARVDIAPGPDGPMLMELEVTEPSLFFRSAPASADRFAAAFIAAANAAQRRDA
jgi:glutathione synthase/RimK-type ligase-like ATP-grasp enzyme